jgi:hypothetical protein
LSSVTSDTSAFCLLNTDYLRFLPALNWNGNAPTLTVVLIDDSVTVTGAAIVDVSTSNRGGTSAFSSNTVVLSHSVTAVNGAPTFTTFASYVASTNEDTEVEITFSDLCAQGDEADVDGTVVSFIIKAVSTGSLRIGANPWNSLSNCTVDATHIAYWTPASNAFGSLNAFTAVAKDDSGAESSTARQATVSVTSVNDAPTFTTFASYVASTNEDTEVEITFSNLCAQGDEADVDGTVVSFIIKAVSTGSLRIGANPWNSLSNCTVDATHIAYWTPASNAFGSLNAFTAVAKDDSGAESSTARQAAVSVTSVNDVPSAPSITSTSTRSRQISIAFTGPTNYGGTDVLRYEYSTSSAFATFTTYNSTSSPLIITGLTNGQSYTYYLRAVNDAGQGTSSGPITVVLPSVSDLKTSGSTAEELKTQNYTCADLAQASYSAYDIESAGYTFSDLIAAGFTSIKPTDSIQMTFALTRSQFTNVAVNDDIQVSSGRLVSNGPKQLSTTYAGGIVITKN